MAIVTEKAPVMLTPTAVAEVKRLREENGYGDDVFLRVGAKGGGCSGLSYVLHFDQTNDSDLHFEQDGVKIVMDKRHQIYLQGMTVDFDHGLNARGFEFQNPNAKESCGCGISFSAG